MDFLTPHLFIYSCFWQQSWAYQLRFLGPEADFDLALDEALAVTLVVATGLLISSFTFAFYFWLSRHRFVSWRNGFFLLKDFAVSVGTVLAWPGFFTDGLAALWVFPTDALAADVLSVGVLVDFSCCPPLWMPQQQALLTRGVCAQSRLRH